MKNLLRLDCESIDSACASLSAFSGLGIREALAKLDRFSESAGSELSGCERWQALADWLCVPRNSFEVYWFHATRTANPESFLKGILPLGQSLEGIWSELAGLIADKVDAIQFADLRRFVECNNYGTGNIPDVIKARLRDQGPYAFLIMAMAIKPSGRAAHNYSHVPEIIEMILSSFPEPHGVELTQRYSQHTRPCIVKFVSQESQPQIVGCAADYLFHLQKGLSLKCFLPWNFDGHGRRIGGDRIVSIDTGVS